MSSLNLVIFAIFLSAASGVPGMFFPRTSGWGQWIAAGFMAAGAQAHESPFAMRGPMMVIALGAGPALFFSARCRLAPQVGTWDCGYARPTSRMQYTASSFAQTIIRMFRWVLHPHRLRPRLSALFPASAAVHSHVDDTVLDQLLLPAGQRVERLFGWFRHFQQGLIQHYVLYILITLIVMSSTLISIRDVLVQLFAR
jgi:hypothetical protein